MIGPGGVFGWGGLVGMLGAGIGVSGGPPGACSGGGAGGGASGGVFGGIGISGLRVFQVGMFQVGMFQGAQVRVNAGRRRRMHEAAFVDPGERSNCLRHDPEMKQMASYPPVSDIPVHDFLLPRLTALVDEAVASGISREVAVAVLINLITSPGFDAAAPDPQADSAPHDMWQRGPRSVVLVAGMPRMARPIDSRDEADVVKPFGGLEPS